MLTECWCTSWALGHNDALMAAVGRAARAAWAAWAVWAGRLGHVYSNTFSYSTMPTFVSFFELSSFPQKNTMGLNSFFRNPSWQSGYFKLALTGRNMQVRFCFEILRLDNFRHYNQFLWNAYCAPSIGPDVNHPHFHLVFAQFLSDFCLFFLMLSYVLGMANYSKRQLTW